MSLAYACDGEDCDTYQHQERARSGWLTVCELGNERTWHFCSVDCLLLFFGQRSPGEELPGR
jgi:hypothetical protein